jgi:Spermine/spermidine synthase domain/SET domain
LLKEADLEDLSPYAPYVDFLKNQNTSNLPYNWSPGGQALLADVLGHFSQYKELAIPPRSPFGIMNDYKSRCKWTDDDDDDDDDEDIYVGSLETLFAIQVMQRSYREHMIPLYDFYNHANGPLANVKVKFITDKETGNMQMIQIYARRDIVKGEQLRRSYYENETMGDRASKFYGTLDMLRDYGFVEDYPQRWAFVYNDFRRGFDVTYKNETVEAAKLMDAADNVSMDDLKLALLDWSKMNVTYMVDAYFRRHLHRMNQSVEPLMHRLQLQLQGKSSDSKQIGDVPSALEFSIVRKLVDSLKVAFQLYLKAANEYELNSPDVKPYREIRREQGRRDPFDHETFPTYNEQFYAKPGRDDWVTVNQEDSGYQTIRFMSHEGDKNICFVLDGEPQTCSYFSAHYHDLACHYPTRYLETVKRVAIIGGGDSKMLQDVLQYNETLEKVIHLELDQKGTRKCFKYFATEPYFDDDRIEWYFGDAAKSLLMIPSDYFGTFDLVFVDLSESGPLSLSVTSDLTIWESIAQLVSPNGYVKANVPKILYPKGSELLSIQLSPSFLPSNVEFSSRMKCTRRH